MRKMYDAVIAHNIPEGAGMVAGYVDGRYKWNEEDWDRFPNAVKVRIAVLPETNDGHVLDVEPGNGTPEESVRWVRMRRAAGVDPTIYCGLADWQRCKQAFLNAGEPEPHFWIAKWDRVEELPPGTVAKQFNNTPGYDESIVHDHWPGVDVVHEEPKAPVPETPPVAPVPEKAKLDTDELVKLFKEAEDDIVKALSTVRSLSDHISSLSL